MPVVLVVTGAGQGDHHGTIEGQDHGTEAPAASAPIVREALQLACQVEGGEAQARKSNCVKRKKRSETDKRG